MSYYNNRGMGRGRGGSGFNSFRSSFGADRGSNRSGGRGGGGYNSRGGYGSRGRGGGGRGGPGPRFGGSGSMHSSFNDSRSSDRYSGGGGGNRYDDYKPYRSENSSFSGRDRSPDRKRFREDALKASQPHNGLFVQAPSSRRSNDGGYGAGGGTDSFNSSRSFDSSYTERRGFMRGDRRQYQMSTPRDDFRKPGGGGFLPSRGPPQSHRSPRGGGFRGRISTRGSRPPMRFREQPHMASSRGRRLNESSYAVQRRVRITRIADMRRRKISLIRSKALAHAKKDLGIADDDKKAEDDEEEKDDEDMKDDDEVEDHGEEEEEADAEVDGEAKKKTPKKDAKEGDADKTESGGEETLRHREFIKLVCPHCHSYCLTFNKYIVHLRGGRHAQAMRKVALKQKAILNRLRQSQRNNQRDLEKNADGLSSHSNFCPLCKLNYKTPKNVHQASDSHKSMKKFLMPFCKVCKRTCKSPMMYENHVCSLEHIKRKARQTTVNGDKSDKEDEEEEEEEEGSGNEENFMTIDSVGDVDDGEGKETVVKKEKEGDEDEKSTLLAVNIGIEQIRKVEVHYCDLCRIYLARGDEVATERIIARHCKMLTHMQRYIRYKEDKEIELRAQKLQHKEAAEKKAKEEALENALKKEQTTDGEKKTEDEETVDDKLWADVDKDLGDILAEAETGNKSSDEEEEKTGERYDRFGSIKKNEEVKEAGDAVAKEEKNGDTEVVAAAN